MKKNDISFKYPLTLKEITGRHGKNIFVVTIKNDSNKGWGSCWNGQKCPDGRNGHGCLGKILQIDNNDLNSISQLEELFKILKKKVKGGITKKISFDNKFKEDLKDKNQTAFEYWDSEWPKVEEELLSGTQQPRVPANQANPSIPASLSMPPVAAAIRGPSSYVPGVERVERDSNSASEYENNSNSNNSNSNSNSNSNNVNKKEKQQKKKTQKTQKNLRSRSRKNKRNKPGLLETMRKNIKQAENYCDKCKKYERYLTIEPFKSKKYRIAHKFINKLKNAQKECKICRQLCKYIQKGIKNPDLRKDKEEFGARYPRLCRVQNGSIKAMTIKKGLKKKLIQQYTVINK